MEMTFYSTRTVYRIMTKTSTGTAPSSTPLNSNQTLTSLGSVVVEASATVSTTPVYMTSGTGASNATLSGYSGASGTPAGAPLVFDGAGGSLGVSAAMLAVVGGAVLMGL